MNYNRHIDDRDRLMNKWRWSATSELTALVRDVVVQLENYEKLAQLRKRARRPADYAIFYGCVEVLVCDMIHRALTSENMKGRIAISLDTSIKSSRYKAVTDSRQFPYIVDLMTKAEMDWLEVCSLGGWQIGRRTAVRATERLLDRVDFWGIEVTDMELRGDEEIVIQKRGKHDPHNRIDGRAEWLDYPDSNIATKYRREVREINEGLRAADILYTGGRLVDLTDTRMRRYFNNASFKQGGRLFGGFWQHLRARQVKHISIDGRAVAEVDFECMQVALARAAAGTPHDIWRDAYNITGYEDHRAGIKKILASMLFTRKPLNRWPRETQCLFEPDTCIAEVCGAIERAHPEIADQFYCGMGFKHMFTESQVLVRTLLRLKEAGVVSLPKHDCVVVPENRANLAAKLMRESFEAITGGTVCVTVNGSKLLAVS